MQTAIELSSYLKNLKLGPPSTLEDLTLYPVVGPPTLAGPLLDLEEALRSGLVEITEVSEQGSVPELELTNRSDKRVILLDGEELTGAKQNRIVNVTIIVAAMTSLTIPVSCVERGRWSWKSRRFQSSDSFSFASLRRDKFGQVSESLRTGSGFRSDQGRIWDQLVEKMSRLGTSSSTDSMKDMSDQVSLSDQRLEEHINRLPDQLGYLAFIRGGFAGGDVFATPELCHRRLFKMVRGYHLDSLDRSVSFPELGPEQVLSRIPVRQFLETASVGEGREMRFTGEQIQGALTLLDGQPVHLTVFPVG